MGTTTIFIGTDGTFNNKENDNQDGTLTNVAKLYQLFDNQKITVTLY